MAPGHVSLACALAAVAACGATGNTTTSAGPTATSTADGGMSASGSSGGVPHDLPSPAGECDLFAQDCAETNHKCMPWSLQEDRIPDETKCCPMVANPKAVGEPCEIFDYDGSCLDDCGKGAVCVLETNSLGGYCHRICDPGDTESCDGDETCKPFFETFEQAPEVPLCMEHCDPLTQDCARPDWACAPDSPTNAGQSGFICIPPPPQDAATFGETCALSNDCEAGLACVPRERFVTCDFLLCCTSYCDRSAPEDTCPALDPAMACVDWMATDPQWRNVGACGVPS